MVPPSATPNPHRFSTAKHSQTQPPSRPHQLPTPQAQSSQQFASTPRFAFGLSAQTPYSSSTAQKPRKFSSPILPKRHPSIQSRYPAAPRNDDIEEPSSDSGDDVTQAPHHPTQSRSTNQQPQTEIIEDPPSPPQTSPCHKRRRVHPSDSILSISSSPSPSPPPPPPPTSTPPPPSSPGLADPTTSTTHHPTRFILSPKPSRHAPTSPHLPTRPPFTLPPRSPSPPALALLTHPLFSPQRKGGPKFVSGGLAGYVRDWVVDLAASAATSRRTGEKDEGGWDKRVVVGEVRGGERVTFVKEKGRDGEAERWMLAGQGQDVVRTGDVVGVRGPVWEVEVKGERWNVGVDWGVVDV
ncbi:MAG: hypothetical protein Q9184_005183 [Pyrenodesmia sp. 2 TL-2023]